jgi:hypothetical protein
MGALDDLTVPQEPSWIVACGRYDVSPDAEAFLTEDLTPHWETGGHV